METLLNLKILVPLIPLFRPETHLSDYFENGIDELVKLSKKLSFKILELGEFDIAISCTDSESLNSFKNRLVRQVLVFETQIPNNYKNFEVDFGGTYSMSDEEHQSFFKTVVSNEFKTKLFHFLILCNIAKPGIIKTREGEVYVNDNLESNFYPLISIHRESLDDVAKLKWPNYSTLHYVDVLNWFTENKFTFERYSKSTTERALCAFTHLFKENSMDFAFDLFWSLIGIEALFCKGKEGLSEQIFNKTQVLLGEMTDYKKRLKQMYDFRSRLIHGELDVPPNRYEYDDEANEKFHSDLYDSTFLAVAILTATFQKMVESQKREITFKYIIT